MIYKFISMIPHVLLGTVFLPVLVLGAPPIFAENLATSGMPVVQRIQNVSEKNVFERIVTEHLPDGRVVEVAIRLPQRDGKIADRINGIVFVAPYVHERFRTARSPLARALVARLGCAVVSISAERLKPGDDPLTRSYVYPGGGYYPVVEKTINEIKQTHGDFDTPVFAIGYCLGGVMAMYLSQSKTLSVDGVVALELTQTEEETPGLFEIGVPTLLINPEDSPWNAMIAARHGQAAEKGAPAAFFIARPIVDASLDGAYYRKAGGRYSNELAFCFIRDAIVAKAYKLWPQKWGLDTVRIEGIGASWEQQILSSGPDFTDLYKTLTHNRMEIQDNGTTAYSCVPPFIMRRGVVFLKKGSWHPLDRVRLSATLVKHGCAAVVCSVPEADSVDEFVGKYIVQLKQLGLEISILTFDEVADRRWGSAVALAAGEAQFITLRRGEATELPQVKESSISVTLMGREGYVPARDVVSPLVSEQTWIHPAAFDELVAWLVDESGAVSQVKKPAGGKLRVESGNLGSP